VVVGVVWWSRWEKARKGGSGFGRWSGEDARFVERPPRTASARRGWGGVASDSPAVLAAGIRPEPLFRAALV
jgi:hypothetical protein